MKRICSAPGCDRLLSQSNASGLCRSHRMRALHADPEFAKAHAERMRALHADPEFAKANAERMRALNADPEFNPLVALTEAERADYDTFKRNGYSRQDALKSVGRGDLIGEAS